MDDEEVIRQVYDLARALHVKLVWNIILGPAFAHMDDKMDMGLCVSD